MKPHSFNEKLLQGTKEEANVCYWLSAFYHLAPATLELQRLGIDRIGVHRRTLTCMSFEIKADSRAEETGNAFVEIVSNDVKEKKGWAYTCSANLLLYYLPQKRLLYLIQPYKLRQKLRSWYRLHKKRWVLNDGYRTQGLLVPLRELESIAEAVVQIPSPCIPF